ncbi:DUF424 domain-containing protein [Haloarchaeobius sp. FL176]|uniref:DUF424 domain-containing protein n=1 Tax=Haloarchaeobius sp. FL176 TaxID=2967129 RepID=UPI0021481184|nr:DUF424 family protein [Haloarchaeobius sp. FL176]
MILNERRTEEGLLVSVCDPDVLGETFEDGDLSLTVSEEFYAGDEVDEDQVIDSLHRASVANIVGERSVTVAIDAGIVEEANVLTIEDTLHAQLLRLG